MKTNQHDATFKALLSQRMFATALFKTYLPDLIACEIDWESLELLKIGSEHVNVKTNQKTMADVVYLAKTGQGENLLWIHAEHQSSPDKLMPLRMLHYQLSVLLDYAKANQFERLPPIVGLVYYHGNQEYPYSLDIEDLIEDSEAKKYFLKPVLIDLASLSDEELRSHEGLAGVELAFKHVRKPDFMDIFPEIVPELAKLNGEIQEIGVKYVLEMTRLDVNKMIESINEHVPGEEGETMKTAAQQLRDMGMQQGMQIGLQEGELRAKHEMAKKFISLGVPVAVVSKATGLQEEEISSFDAVN